MKTRITAVALALTTLTVSAQEATPVAEFETFVSTRTRADVQAELRAAIASGWLPSRGESGDDHPAQRRLQVPQRTYAAGSSNATTIR